MKKSFFLYQTEKGDVVLSGYPSWVHRSDIYPFRLYTFLLDERSSARIGKKSVSINTVDCLIDQNEAPAPIKTDENQLTINFTPWRKR